MPCIVKTDEDLKYVMQVHRQQLLKALENLPNNEIALQGKRKTIRKGFTVEQGDFRGSRYRGVSKNKGKWQVRFSSFHSFLSLQLLSKPNIFYATLAGH